MTYVKGTGAGRFEIRDPRPETRDPRPETRDPRPETRDMRSEAEVSDLMSQVARSRSRQGARGRGPGSESVLRQGRHHHGFDRVEAILGLVEDDAGGGFEDFVGHFEAVRHVGGIHHLLAHGGVRIVERR